MAAGQRDSLSSDNAGPLNLRSGVPLAVVVTLPEILASTMAAAGSSDPATA